MSTPYFKNFPSPQAARLLWTRHPARAAPHQGPHHYEDTSLPDERFPSLPSRPCLDVSFNCQAIRFMVVSVSQVRTDPFRLGGVLGLRHDGAENFRSFAREPARSCGRGAGRAASLTRPPARAAPHQGPHHDEDPSLPDERFPSLPSPPFLDDSFNCHAIRFMVVSVSKVRTDPNGG